MLHTIRGISGAAPGICNQCGESRDNCLRHITDILPLAARAQCMFLYTDDVKNFLGVRGSGSKRTRVDVLPSLSVCNLQRNALYGSTRIF